MASLISAADSICVDGRMIDASATGVGTYSDTLLSTLRQMGTDPLVLMAIGRPRHHLMRLAGALRRRSRTAQQAPEGGRLCAGPELFREAQIHFDLYGRALTVETDAKPGIMHWTYPVPLRMIGWRNIYTVHDTIPLDHPDITPIRRQRHRRLLNVIARHADGLVAVSEAARIDVVTALGCDESLVTAVPQGVIPLPTGGALPPNLRADGYFLYCGSIEPRKNLCRLIDAYRLSSSRRPLVFAGPSGWRAATILNKIAGDTNITHLTYQSREALGALVRDARALLFPSLAEGFGLPVVEAMMAGTAVMTSNKGALAEVAGEAALLVDPMDESAMAAGISRLDREDVLVMALADLGRSQADRYSIAAYSERLTHLHNQILGCVR